MTKRWSEENVKTVVGDTCDIMTNYKTVMAMVNTSLSGAEGLVASLLLTMYNRDEMSQDALKLCDQLAMQIHETREKIMDIVGKKGESEVMKYLISKGL